MFSLQGNHALVTGGASGLGLAIAKRFTAAGAVVTVCDLADPAGVCAEIGASFVRADVSDAAQVDAAFAGVLFTCNLQATGADLREMIAEYCSGLGDKLVAGEIQPHRIAITRDAHRMLHASATADHGPPFTLDESTISQLFDGSIW